MLSSKQSITLLMKNIKGFKEFMRINDIGENCVRSAAKYIKFRHFKAKDVIFKQFDISEKFYGILKGEVSIRVSNNAQIQQFMKHTRRRNIETLSQNVLKRLKTSTFYDMEILGDEVIKFSSGQCFGQWGLIEGKERTASAIALEDCYFFEISKFGFEEAFKKALFRSEQVKKNFILGSLSPLKELADYKFDNLYKMLIPTVKT